MVDDIKYILLHTLLVLMKVRLFFMTNELLNGKSGHVNMCKTRLRKDIKVLEARLQPLKIKVKVDKRSKRED